jgi:hypothetical protein
MKRLIISIAMMASSAFAADLAKATEPGYDAATVINVSAKVTGVYEVPKDKAMAGLHVTLQVEGQALDIYIGPSEFAKVFDFTLTKGDQIRVLGSKVNFEGSTVVLTREVTLGGVTLVCRDKDGSPLWKYFVKVPVG